ncbi:MAG: DegQ family serine endoprotease [Gammaproteobacteria bacterium]|nr:MAG: DegQ family serine endoprotease [Gammaproteobacteria bacterium]
MASGQRPGRFGALLLTALLLWAQAVSAVIPVAEDGKMLPTLAPMLEKVTPGVVNISTEGHVEVPLNPLFQDPVFRHFFNLPQMPLERKFTSLGSGVIVDAGKGLVLTNNHVIANADQITVTLRDGRSLDAELVGTDPETDVALLRIPAEDLTEVPMADSDKVRVGDFVVAIGNPFGLGQTVTSGIVSALGRSGTGIESYENFIQTDASINPGNSGGALVNLRGELIGINTAIFSKTGGNIGIGFAIPVNMAKAVMEQLLEYGEVNRGKVGVLTQDLTPELARAFGLKRHHGVVIVEVEPGSPAEEAGLQPGDIVVAVNGRKVRNGADVRNFVGLQRVGSEVTFEILRDGKRLEKKVKLAPRESLSGQSTRHPALAGATIGEMVEGHPLYGRVEGALVLQVEPGSRAWRNGLRRGDVITSVNRQRVRNLKDFIAAVSKAGTKPLVVRVQRGNAAAFLVLK